MLGKRKREVAVAPRRRERISTDDENPTPTTSADASQDLFRKYFESAFEPLPESKMKPSSHPEGDESESEGEDLEDENSEATSEESAWEGLSDAGQQDAEVVVVVEHNATAQDAEELDSRKRQYKSFMVSHDAHPDREMLTEDKRVQNHPRTYSERRRKRPTRRQSEKMTHWKRKI